MACGLYYFCVKHIVDNRDNKSLFQCLKEGLDEGFRYYSGDLRNLSEKSSYGRLYDLDAFKDVPSSEIKTTGYVVDTLEAAIWNLITTDSYEACELQTVNMGDDSDTVGAVAGGLAGLYYGVDAIPVSWVDAIVSKDYIYEICDEANALWK